MHMPPLPLNDPRELAALLEVYQLILRRKREREITECQPPSFSSSDC